MGFRSSRGKLCGFLVCFGLVCLFMWSVRVVIRTSVWEQPGADGCDARGLVEKGKGERGGRAWAQMVGLEWCSSS